MDSKQAKKEKSLGLGNIYLIFYNVALTAGWFYILIITQQTFMTWKSNEDILSAKNLYNNVEFLLQVFQTLALLEVVHAAIGLVKSNPMLVLFQVLSRLLVVWAVTYLFVPSRNCVGVFVVCIAWPIAEIVRYSYYALNILNMIPYALTWCRYTFFIVLYPVGVSGELICIYTAFKHVEPLAIRSKFSYYLPNVLNISFDIYYALLVSMILYFPIFPMLYNHMRAQRRKILSPSKDKKTN